MKESKPILFSTEMVQAILEGRKTQTRRVIKPQPVLMTDKSHFNWDGEYYLTKEQVLQKAKIQKGTILWVRETWQYNDDLEFPYLYKQKEQEELTSEAFKRLSWKPSIFMPKEACRVFLEITNVRVERLQDISQEDAKAEGIKKTWISDREELCMWKNYINDGLGSLDPAPSFRSLWQSINGDGSWNANPWVWVYDFKRVEKPF